MTDLADDIAALRPEIKRAAAKALVKTAFDMLHAQGAFDGFDPEEVGRLKAAIDYVCVEPQRMSGVEE